jgi:tetrahydromethanopterin S-methyltransferase subunit B
MLPEHKEIDTSILDDVDYYDFAHIIQDILYGLMIGLMFTELYIIYLCLTQK